MNDLKRILEAEAVRLLIGGASVALDDADFDRFLGYCDDPFTYRIRAWSPELKKDMTWLEHNRHGMVELFKTLPQHLQRLGRLHRQVTVATVEPSNVDGFLVVISPLTVHYTDLEGQTQTLAVGRYVDIVNMTGEKIVLAARDAMLDTRDLGIGLHVPI
ncbi:MAG: aromatic-ring-hydroxylating dioxygenase subunit beta [Rhodospirillaceae bacterium]